MTDVTICNDVSLEPLSPEALRDITVRAGVDAATSVLYDAIVHSPRHAQFIQQISSLRENPAPTKRTRRFKVVIVPGALYIERPKIGGDGRLVREVIGQLGWESELIPLASIGSLTQNAMRLSSWLANRHDDEIILVSLSKAGPEVKLAMSFPDSEKAFRNVVAWINVCGPLNGTPMANWIADHPLRSWLCRLQYKIQHRDFRFITELRHGQSSLLCSPLATPPRLKMISLVGFPLKKHMSTLASRFCHRTLSKYGPNDGTIVLSDLLKWPGDIYPVWGADHYFRPASEAKGVVRAVLNYVSGTIQR